MTNKIVISADSTVDLSPELAEKYSVVVSPMLITMGEKTYTDGLDIDPQDLFDYTKSTGQLAKTAAQSTAYYADYFEKLSADGSAVIHFSISGSMSSAFNFARIAAEDMDNVYVVDSQNLSTGIALLVLKAADLVAEGKTAKEVYDEICALRSRVDASFVIDTLEFLHKGGRCSAIAMLGANVLKLRPCIEVKDGAMGVARKYRGKMSNVYKEYAKDQLHDPDDIDLTRVFVTHTCGDDPVVDEIVELVKQTLPFKEVIKTTAGCTISAHCGPGTLGVLFFRKSDKK